MSGAQINLYSVGDVDLTAMMDTLDKQRVSFRALILTNLGNALEPEIASGSLVEVAGALFKFAANEAITGWAGIGATTKTYIKLVPAGASPDTVTAEFTDTTPVWDSVKQGYYGTGGSANHRYIAGLYKVDAATYSNKKILTLTPSQDAGQIAAFIMQQQEGWLWCDGSQINKSTNPEYTNLVGILKQEAGADAAHPYYNANADIAVLPNLKGTVVRGIDTAANRDKDGVRKSGNYQADDNKAHTHNVRARNSGTGATGILNEDPLGGLNDIPSAALSSGAVEATMKNVALYYLIKY